MEIKVITQVFESAITIHYILIFILEFIYTIYIFYFVDIMYNLKSIKEEYKLITL